MTRTISIRRTLVYAALAATAGLYAASPEPSAAVGALSVQGGTVSFDVPTNVPALGVHGKSSALLGRAEVRVEGTSLVIEGLEARVPVPSLGTGLGLRDSHMRKYIFTTADGQVPDVTFAARRVECAASGTSRAATCPVAGDLTIRGTTKPSTFNLKVNPDGASYRAVGDGTVTLSTFGIERPSQFGVSTADEVAVHFEFVAKASTVPSPVGTGGAR
jgi:polyisoprenoid-binding protein YceI